MSFHHKGHGGHKGSQFILWAVDDAADTLTKVRNVEVDQEPELVSAKPEIRDQLGRVNRQQFLHTLDFDDEAVFDDEVDAIGGRKLDSVVCDRQPDLVLKVQAGSAEFVEETCITSTLQHSRPEGCVHLDCSTDDNPAGLVWTHEMSSSFVSFVSFVVECRKAAKQGSRRP